MNKEQFDARQEAINDALIRQLKDLNPSDPDWDKKYRMIQGLYRELNQDNQNQVTESTEEQKVAVSKDEISTNKFLEIFKSCGGWILGGAGTALGIYEAVSLNKRYKISSKYEEENAYLTQTDKATIQDGLKSKPSGSKLKFW